MGRLVRLLLGILARGLRAVAGRLAPAPAVAPGAESPPAAADGPPGHWLAMVRTRAPGLHLSLQERGVVGRHTARPERPLAAVAPASALEPRQSDVPRPSARPAVAMSRPSGSAPAMTPPTALASPAADGQPDLAPHGWRSPAADEQEEWTRVTTRRSCATAPAAATTPLNPADAVVARAWRSRDALRAEAAPQVHPPVAEPRRPETRPGLRPVPVLPARDTDRHTAATPVFAPSRDEDAAMHRAVPPRRSWPTPTPTPWRVEALQAPLEEPAGPPFPPLPDEVPAVAAPAAHAASTSAARADRWRPSPRNEPAGAWPMLPGARIPPSRPSLAVEDRPRSAWPELPDDGEGRDDEGFALPDGHRERLAREQRGLAWNG